MIKKTFGVLGVALALALGFVAGRVELQSAVAADTGKLSALDYDEITQLINRYAYGIDTCGGNGYDYANVFTTDGQFIDKNSDAGFAAGGRVLAKGRDALAELVGGGSKGCKTTLPWTGWSHLMLNHEITATPELPPSCSSRIITCGPSSSAVWRMSRCTSADERRARTMSTR